MKIEYIDNQTIWNSLLLAQDTRASFVQSAEWGEVLKSEGKNIERLAVKDGEDIVALAQMSYHKAFFWTYAFCAKGPVFKYQVSSIKYQEIYKQLNKYLEEKKCIFFRIEPRELLVKDFKGTIKKIKDINPRATLILDLNKSEEQLLQEMHQKTRYNIRLAEKKSLIVHTEKNVAVFMKLMKETGERDGFRLHEQKHYEHIFDSPLSFQISIMHEGEPVAVGVFVAFGKTFTYLYGASHYASRNLMAPYLMQWEGIKLGKKLGYQQYDFFGIAPKKKENINEKQEYEYDVKHQYAGVTRFKLGFGGQAKEDVGTCDLVLKPISYKLYQILRKIRRLI